MVNSSNSEILLLFSPSHVFPYLSLCHFKCSSFNWFYTRVAAAAFSPATLVDLISRSVYVSVIFLLDQFSLIPGNVKYIHSLANQRFDALFFAKWGYAFGEKGPEMLKRNAVLLI